MRIRFCNQREISVLNLFRILSTKDRYPGRRISGHARMSNRRRFRYGNIGYFVGEGVIYIVPVLYSAGEIHIIGIMYTAGDILLCFRHVVTELSWPALWPSLLFPFSFGPTESAEKLGIETGPASSRGAVRMRAPVP